jgi:hypothetical protein
MSQDAAPRFTRSVDWTPIVKSRTGSVSCLPATNPSVTHRMNSALPCRYLNSAASTNQPRLSRFMVSPLDLLSLSRTTSGLSLAVVLYFIVCLPRSGYSIASALASGHLDSLASLSTTGLMAE